MECFLCMGEQLKVSAEVSAEGSRYATAWPLVAILLV